MPMVTAEKNRLLDLSTSGAYVALFNGDPTGAGSELAFDARIALGGAGAAAGADSNAGALRFENSSGGPLSVTHFAIYSAITAGTMRWAGTITNKTVADGDAYEIPIGDLDLAIQDA